MDLSAPWYLLLTNRLHGASLSLPHNLSLCDDKHGDRFVSTAMYYSCVADSGGCAACISSNAETAVSNPDEGVGFLLLWARSENCGKWLLASYCLSAWNSSAPTGRIFMKFYILLKSVSSQAWSVPEGSRKLRSPRLLYILVFFKNLPRRLKISLNPVKNNSSFTRRPVYIFWTYLGQLFSEWELFQTKGVQKIKADFYIS